MKQLQWKYAALMLVFQLLKAQLRIPFYVPSVLWIPRLISFSPERTPAALHNLNALSHGGALTFKASVMMRVHRSCLNKPSLGLLQSLCQWVLSVKKNYRKNVAYHNWRHAFNTAQSMFALLKSGRLQVSSANQESAYGLVLRFGDISLLGKDGASFVGVEKKSTSSSYSRYYASVIQDHSHALLWMLWLFFINYQMDGAVLVGLKAQKHQTPKNK